MGIWGFSFITFIDLSAAVIIFLGALSERMRLYPVWHKVGLITAVIGLVAQAFRNLQFIFTGYAAPDNVAPLWAMKDVGLAIIAYTYLYIAIKPKLNPNPKRKASKKK